MSNNNNSKKSVDDHTNDHHKNKFKKHSNKVYNSRFESSVKSDDNIKPKEKEVFKPVNNKVYERDLNFDKGDENISQDRSNEYRPRQNYNNRNENREYQPRQNYNNRNENGEYRPRQNYNNRNENGEYRPRQNHNNKNENGEYRPRQNYNNNGEHRSSQSNDSDSTIKVNNLDKNLDEDALRQLFSQFGRINRVSLPKDSRNGQPRGFAYVAFATRSEAESAFENLQGQACGHLLLRLEWAESYKQKNNNGEYRPRQNYNNRQNYNKFDNRDPESIENIEAILKSGKFMHQSKRDELEKKLNYLKENSVVVPLSDQPEFSIPSNNPWSKTKETKVMSNDGVEEANKIAKQLYIEGIQKEKLKKLELQKKKEYAKQKLAYSEDDYYGNEFFEESDYEETVDTNYEELENQYKDSYQDI